MKAEKFSVKKQTESFPLLKQLGLKRSFEEFYRIINGCNSFQFCLVFSDIHTTYVFFRCKSFVRQCSLVSKLKQNFRKTTKQKNSITKKNHLWKNQY